MFQVCPAKKKNLKIKGTPKASKFAETEINSETKLKRSSIAGHKLGGGTQEIQTMSSHMDGEKSDLSNVSCKVAPGMEISYIIKFSPETKMDYSYDLMIVTEREKFIVPIRAVGYRSMLDFPDTLDFGLVPVKHTAEKPVMIRNIGEKTTKWHLKVPDGFLVDK